MSAVPLVAALDPDAIYALSVGGKNDAGLVILRIVDMLDQGKRNENSIRLAALPTDEVQEFLLCTRCAVSIALPPGTKHHLVAQGSTAALKRLKLRVFGHDAITFDNTGGLTAYPIPRDKAAARAFHKSLKIARLLDLSPERSFDDAERQNLLGWADDLPASPVLAASKETAPSMAIVLHLYYTDLWPQFAGCLSRLETPFSLIVTLNAADPALETAIRQQFPSADIRILPNFGRDLGPFFTLLDDGSLDRFDFVCKLHGKKSLRDGKPTLLGWSWLQRSLMELLGGPERVSKTIARFKSDPQLGMVGPAPFRIPNARFPEKDAWGGNREVTLAMAARVTERAQSRVPFTLDFFAGTMFWFRPKAFAPLRGMGLSDPKTYAAEAGRIDGALEHALERVLPYAVTSAGYTLGTVPPLD